MGFETRAAGNFGYGGYRVNCTAYHACNTCADPESFFRGGPTLTSFFFAFFFSFFFKFLEGLQIPLKAGHHRPASETPFNLNGVSLACQ